MDYNKLWEILKEMGIPDHLTCLLRNLYAGQEATVRTGHPEGALEIAKDIAVKEEIPDVNKRKMLSEKVGLNINNAIMVNHVMEEEESKEEESPKQRRVQLKDDAPAESKRRAAAPKYNVVSTGK